MLPLLLLLLLRLILPHPLLLLHLLLLLLLLLCLLRRQHRRGSRPFFDFFRRGSASDFALARSTDTTTFAARTRPVAITLCHLRGVQTPAGKDKKRKQ